MVTPFELVITRMWDLGVFHFLLYMLTSAVFYGLLRKSKLFGDPKENVAVNAVVAIVASLMVWASPVIVFGVDIIKDLMLFFAQSLVAMIVLLVSLLMLSMLMPPDLPTKLSEAFKGKWLGGLLIVFLVVGFGILVSSGLSTIFFPGIVAPGIAISEDIIITLGVLLLLVITVAVIIYIGGR